jgi:hypothetical protein
MEPEGSLPCSQEPITEIFWKTSGKKWAELKIKLPEKKWEFRIFNGVKEEMTTIFWPRKMNE